MSTGWTPKPADSVVRHPRQSELAPINVTVTPRKAPSRFTATPMMISYAFLGLILIGTLLLLPPCTHHGDGMAPITTALFTSTSAITVTGLVVENTASYWTKTGQAIILGMMYIGGLGFMSLATFMLVLIGRRVNIREQLVVREILMVDQLGSLVRISIGIVIAATSIQLVGAIALFSQFYFIHPTGEAVWQAIFHSVSAFNSAGFNVLTQDDELIAFNSHAPILGIMALLIFIGAISYLVIIDVVRIRRFSKFALNTKLVLVSTLVLTLIGIGSFLALEYQNPQTIGALSVQDKLLNSVFQTVSTRSAGFTVVDQASTHEGTKFLTMALMFTGGASASVAGGIKVNTLAVIFIAIFALIKGRSHISAFGREMPWGQVQRAFVIAITSLTFVFMATILLEISDGDLGFSSLLFEEISAFGTLGLSTGITPDVSVWGRFILIISMFIGRLGPLTLGLTMAQRREADIYRYAREPVVVG